jgi:hypothetical protein
VKATTILAVLMFALPFPVMASGVIAFRFVVDGKLISCTSTVEFDLDGRAIVAESASRGFIVPAIFNKKPSEWPSDKTVQVKVSCGDYALNFPKLPPSWVSPGQWEVGIAYPPAWIERFGYLRAVEEGTWLSYLESECNSCDPGVFTTVSHPNPPASLIASLRREQPKSSGGRARDIAYALAVFDAEYQQNRDSLLDQLNVCLARPRESLEDDVCDGRVLDYVTNLYWRGDSTLLQPLLRLADSRKDVIHEIGRFYADLLDRRTETIVDGLSELVPEKQMVICQLAGEDEFSIDEPKLERVTERLRAIGNETAKQCLRVAEKAANDVPWRQPPT